MKQKHSWEITDEFWAAAQPLIPQKQRDPAREYRRKSGGGRKPLEPRTLLAARQAPYTGISGLGEQGMFQACWKTGRAK